MDLTKILRYISYGLMGISVLVSLLFFFTGVVTENFYLIWTYLMTGLACAGVVIFSIYEMITNPKKAKNVLISGGSLLLVLLVSYVIATSEIPHFLGYEKFNLTAGDVKWVGGSLIATYILMTVATVGIFFSEISKMFKK